MSDKHPKPIRFKFNAKKAAQAANKLLRLSGGKRNYMELVKLLYLADREALIRLESQITGDRLVSLRFGPVLSRVLNLIKEGPVNEEDAPWFEAVSPPSGYDVHALGDSGEDELSGAEVKILDETFAKHGQMDWKELSRFTHNLQEWTDPGNGSNPISIEQILLLGGKSPQRIESISKEISAFDRLDMELAEYEEAQSA